MHIGLIGGLGPAATRYYYRELVAAHKALDKVMKLTIAHADINQYLSNMTTGSKQQQAEIFNQHVTQLKGAGCDAVAVTTMAGHFCIQELEAISSLPILNIIPLLNSKFAEKGYKRIGLLGSRVVLESGIYGGISEAQCIAPEGDYLTRVHDAYIAMALAEHASDTQRQLFFDMGKKLMDEQECDVIALAGTDLFLAFEDHDPGFPVIDSADVHIENLVALSTSRNMLDL